jgi:hypothetical protein
MDRPADKTPLKPPVTVLFSGGSDSTLTASLLAREHEHVHLLTYKHRIMRFGKKCLKSLDSLQKAYGEDRFTHAFLDLNPIFDKLFFGSLAADLRRWGTYALPMCCGSCKLAMHVRTIQYNLEHGIRFAADGSNIELAELFPEQMPPVLELYRQLYERFGIVYTNPVFDVRRTDHRLFEEGVTERRDFKQQKIIYTNQHSCYAGTFLHAYTLGVSLPLFGRSSDTETATRYVAAKIEEFCLPWLGKGGA